MLGNLCCMNMSNSEGIKELRAVVQHFLPSSTVYISSGGGDQMASKCHCHQRVSFPPKSSAFSFIKLWANLMFEDDLPVYVPNFGAIQLFSWSL